MRWEGRARKVDARKRRMTVSGAALRMSPALTQGLARKIVTKKREVR